MNTVNELDPQASDASAALSSEIVAKVSHEFRTPLTAIQESVDIVLDGLAGPLDPRQVEFLALARRNVERLKKLVDDLLDLSSLQGGLVPLRVMDADLRAVTRMAVESRRTLGQTVALDLGLDSRPLMVRMDPERMRQVILRLLDNVAVHCGSPALVRLWREGDEAVIEVADSGPGIPESQLAKIFEAFSQLSEGPGRKVGGAGLGLTLAKRFVERQGGRLWVQSRPGQGARFFIALKATPLSVDTGQ